MSRWAQFVALGLGQLRWPGRACGTSSTTCAPNRTSSITSACGPRQPLFAGAGERRASRVRSTKRSSDACWLVVSSGPRGMASGSRTSSGCLREGAKSYGKGLHVEREPARGHRYSPVRLMCSHPSGETWPRNSAGTVEAGVLPVRRTRRPAGTRQLLARPAEGRRARRLEARPPRSQPRPPSQHRARTCPPATWACACSLVRAHRSTRPPRPDASCSASCSRAG